MRHARSSGGSTSRAVRWTTSSALWLTACAATLSGCDENAPGPRGADRARDTAQPDTGGGIDTGAVTDTSPRDTAELDTPAADTAGQDTAAEETGRACPGATGCPCTDHGQCDDGACTDTPNGRRCARRCVDSCPADRACLPLFGGADPVYYCLPRWGLLCRPCDKGEDCTSAGIKGPRCVPYGDDGSFCGAACGQSADCPQGYVCRLVATAAGPERKQCVRDDPAGGFGTCPCTPAEAAEALATTCWLPWKDAGGKEIGRCRGERMCTAAGLSPCHQLTGPAAACIDAQCEGKPDGTLCDDGDGCTSGDACKAGACTPGPDLCACRPVVKPCPDDADPCNGVPYCDTSSPRYTCQPNPGTVVHCPPGTGDTPCRKNACDPATGQCALLPVAASAACDDGDPCSAGDRCDGHGSCGAGTDTCPCHEDADCAAQEDGNLCNGTLYCDRTEAPYDCRVNPATVRHCPSVDDTACRKNQCVPATGACAMAVQVSASCDDGDPCTAGDLCDPEGGCTPGGASICPCKTRADCAGKDDGDLCNGVPYCDPATHACRLNPATVVYCPSVADTACLRNTCAPGTGTCAATAEKDGKTCDDGDPCTAGDVCAAGVCAPGKTDLCPCQTDGDCVARDDGDLCNGTLYCDKSRAPYQCRPNPATVISCPSAQDTPCRHEVCAPATGKCGLVSRHEQGACDADGNPCTRDDRCAKGECLPGTNLCACTEDQDCAPLDDADKCNGVLFCDRSAADATQWRCRPNPASVVSCPPSASPCRRRLCVPKTGQCVGVPLADGLACEDGDPCTGPDLCHGGACKSGGARCGCKSDGDCARFDDGVACNGLLGCKEGACRPVPAPGCGDGNACTDDACGPGGCVHLPRAATCDDGSACTAGDRCQAGACAAGPALSCDDGNACTDDGCAPKKGCTHAPRSGACSDGRVCTVGDACAGGACRPGSPRPCDDGNPCTADSCDEKVGCLNLNRVGSCDDGDACTAGDACRNGACRGSEPLDCDDANPCTTDGCESKKGCSHLPRQANCDDGNACTAGDACQAGTCVAGATRSCDDGNACTGDACDPEKGCTSTPAEDGTSCGTWKACSAGLCKPVSCDDANPCTADALGPAGCTHTPSPSVACAAGGKPGLCAGKTCKPVGPCPLWHTEITTKQPITRIFALERLSDGGFGFAGQTRTGENGASRWLVGKVDAKGKLLWQVVDGFAPNDGCNTAYSLVPLKDGGVVTAGQKVGQDGRVMRFGAGGKLLWARVVGTPRSPWAGMLAENGDVVFVGDSSGSGPAPAQVLRMNGSGKVLRKTASVLPPGRQLSRPYAVVHTDVGAAVAGVALTSLGGGGSVMRRAWLARLDAADRVSWERQYGPAKNGMFFDLARAPRGGLVAAGWQANGSWWKEITESKAWVAGLDPEGNLLWEGLFPAAKGKIAYARAVAVGADGTPALLGFDDGSTPTYWLRRLGPGGAVRSEQTWQAGKKAVESCIFARLALLPLPGGGFVAGGGVNARGWLRRLDRRGEGNCAKSGLCAHLAGSCDDADPCTADACDPNKGCTHAPVLACKPAPELDLDHDGLSGKADPCPTVWNPDADPEVCAPLGKGWAKGAALKLGQPGLKPGLSTWRRSNEPVEVPLVSGILDDGVAGYWKLDGNARDASGGGHHGAVTLAGPATGAFGRAAGGIELTPPGRIDIAQSPELMPTGSVTVMARVKTSSDKASIIFSNWFGSNWRGLNLGLGHGCYGKPEVLPLGQPVFTIGNGPSPSSCDLVTAPARVDDGTWHHVAGVYRAGPDASLALYVDGVLRAWHRTSITALSYGANLCSTVRLGAACTAKDPKYFFAGALDEVLLVRRALSPAEIAAYYHSRAPYGTSRLPGAQPDLDDLRVTETTPWQKEHRVPFELLGVRPHSDTDLEHVVAYWRLDGDAMDVTGRYHGKLGAGAKAGRGRFGDKDGALVLGADAKQVAIRVPAQPKVEALIDFTVEAWFRLHEPTAGSPGQATALVTLYDPKGTRMGPMLGLQGAGGWRLWGQLDRSGAAAYSVFAAVPLQLDRWHHAALVRRGGKLELYFDGLHVAHEVKAGSSTSLLSMPAPLLAEGAFVGGLGKGVCDTGGCYGLNGAIDEVLVHDVAKSPDYFARRARGLPRVRFLAHTRPHPGAAAFSVLDYRLHWGNPLARALSPVLVGLDGKTKCAGLLSPCLGYVGWWPLDEGGGRAAVDRATGRHHGVIEGGKAGPRWARGGAGTALVFDGVDDRVRVDGLPEVPDSTPFTLEALVRRDGGCSWPEGARIAEREAGDGGYGLAMGCGKPKPAGGPWAGVALGGPANGWPKAVADKALDLGVMTALAMRWAAGRLELLVAGAVVASKAVAKVDSTSKVSFRIGMSSPGLSGEAASTHAFPGLIDGVRLMRRALEPDELLHAPGLRAGWKAGK